MKIRMFCVLTLLAGASAYVVQNKEITSSRPTIVSREEWGGRPPKAIDPMINPVSHVIIHHSYIPPACNNPDECIIAVKEVQDMHMDQRGWNDGGYSFLAGGDGRIYESRGWNRMGAHAVSYNNRSIGICILGDWQVSLPPKEQLQAAKDLIAMGVNEGYISPDYILLGHRQTRPTECPGQALYNEINTWPHYSPCPPPVDSQQNTIGHPSYDCPESKKSRQTDGKQ